jgi:hypothetical protein
VILKFALVGDRRNQNSLATMCPPADNSFEIRTPSTADSPGWLGYLLTEQLFIPTAFGHVDATYLFSPMVENRFLCLSMTSGSQLAI